MVKHTFSDVFKRDGNHNFIKITVLLKFLPRVLLKFIRETFKVAALKYIKPSIGKTIKKIQSFLELSKVVLKFVSETSSK